MFHLIATALGLVRRLRGHQGERRVLQAGVHAYPVASQVCQLYVMLIGRRCHYMSLNRFASDLQMAGEVFSKMPRARLRYA